MKLNIIFLPILFVLFIGNIVGQTEIIKDSLDHPIAMDFYGDRAFVALHGQQPHQGKIVSFDINDPLNSYIVHFDSLSNYPRTLAIKGNDLYIGFTNYIGKVRLNTAILEIEVFLSDLFFPRCMVFNNNQLYFGEDDKISVVNVHAINPTPTVIFENLGVSPLSMAIENEKIYIAMGKDILSYDINSPNSELKNVYTNFEHNIYSIVVMDGKLYLDQSDLSFSFEEILRFELSNPYATLETYISELISVIGMAIHEEHLYFASPIPNFMGGFDGKIIKVTDEIILSSLSPIRQPITIFPNPTNGLLNIQGIAAKQYSILIKNQQGQLVLVSQNKSTFDVHQLPNGFYYLEILDKKTNQIYWEKIVIAK